MTVNYCLKLKKDMAETMLKFNNTMRKGIKTYGKEKIYSAFVARSTDIYSRFNRIYARFSSKIQRLSR